MLALRQMEEDLVQQIDCRAHRGDDQSSEDADQRRQADKTRFPCSDQGAQAPRYFESVGHFCNQDASAIV